MKKYTKQEIDIARKIMEDNKFEKCHVNLPGIEFDYYVLPQSLNPRLPYFAYRYTGKKPEDGYVFGVSDSISEQFRPYVSAHEFIEFMQIPPKIRKGRCKLALEKELGLVPEKLKPQHIDMRLDFFRCLIEYGKINTKDYTRQDITEFELSLARLRELAA